MQSPCINVCQIDTDTRECIGCFRTIDQITRWSRMDDSERDSIMRMIEKRRAADLDQQIAAQE